MLFRYYEMKGGGAFALIPFGVFISDSSAFLAFFSASSMDEALTPCQGVLLGPCPVAGVPGDNSGSLCHPCDDSAWVPRPSKLRITMQ
eukprot:scaffold542020_cov19-Prasinocladus_malaysianus.AAC.1